MKLKSYLNLCLIILLFCGLLSICPAMEEQKPLEKIPENADQSEWLQQALNNIRNMEYNVSWQESSCLPNGKPGFHMANRAQNLRLYFLPDGTQMLPRTKSSPSWNLGWNVSCNSKNKTASSEPVIRTDKNLLEYKRTGFTEQYENTESGIRCAILVDRSGASQGSIRLVIAFNGNMIPQCEPGGTEIEFVYEDKKQVTFQNIRAVDARGASLDLAISLMDDELRLEADSQNAAYPLRLEFLVSSLPPWTGESDKVSALFGKSVATAGDVNGDGFSDIIIGAPGYTNGQYNEGCAFVYYGSPDGPGVSPNWMFESNQPSAKVGQAVATAGDVNGDGFSEVLIGAPGYPNGEKNVGRVFLFYGGETGLGIVPSIFESNAASCNFGECVATAGDVNGDGYADVIVGARGFTNALTNEGKVFVYHGSSGGISTSPSWTMEGDQTGARLGYSACTAGDVNRDGYSDIIIGAPYFNVTASDEGRAWVFLGGASGLAGTHHWSDDGPGNLAYFGSSVCTAGDVDGNGYADIIVGVPGYGNGESREGAAMAYYCGGGGISATPNFTYESNKAEAYMGNSVFTAGDMDGDGYADIIVGAYYYTNSESQEGAAYIFRGSKTGLKTYWDWRQESNQANAYYGESVSLAGDVNGDGFSDVIVGAAYYDNGQDNEGKCFLYYGEPRTPASSYSWAQKGYQDESDFAMKLASAGNVNGDAFSDVIIGAPYFDNGLINEGCVYIFHGRPNDVPDTTPNRILESNTGGAEFGQSVASAGDVNGDGYDDIAIGAPGYNNYAGWVAVYYGSVSGIGATTTWNSTFNVEYARYGASVAGAGDVNGDGYPDVIVGVPGYPQGAASGGAFAYYGGASGLNPTENWLYYFEVNGSKFGECVAGAGDVNADGFSDVIIGAPQFSNGETQEGGVFVFHGSFVGLGKKPNWKCESNQEFTAYGYSTAGAGDVNDDGFADVIVGAPNYDNGVQDEGAAFIYAGGPGGISGAIPIWMGESNQESAYYGYSVSGAGDVNADGFSDVIVGAYARDNIWFLIVPPYSQTIYNGGAAYIYLGSPTGPSQLADWATYSFQENSFLGRCVAGAGDVNGDGFADVIVGVPGYDEDTDEYGQARIYLGGGGNGRNVNPMQYNYTPQRRLGHLSRTDEDAISICFIIRNPFGAGKVKQEWEVQPFGVPLDGTDTFVNPDWWDYNVLSGCIGYNDLTEYSLYHWRCRMRYHPATTPFQPHSRWYFAPWNGNHEADFRIGMRSNYTVQELIDYIIARGGYARDPNTDGKTNSADVLHKILNP